MPIKKILITEAQIAARIAELGQSIADDYRNADLVVVGILNGAFVFMADLVRRIDLPLAVDFVRVSSYGCATASSGCCTLTKDTEISLTGKDVLLVEDIIDTGRTLVFLQDYLASKNLASLRVCALINKHERRESAFKADYIGFDVAEGFLVGYGLDHAEQYRHLPAIYRISEE